MKDKYLKLFSITFILMWTTYAFGLDGIDSIGKSNRTVIEGELLHVSKLPSPEGNAYPDCYYTATVSIDHIINGQSIPKKIILVLPGFFSRQYAPESKYKIGDKVRTTVVPFASMPDKVKQAQQADEIEDVDLDFYFPEKIVLIQEFQIIANPVPYAGKNQKGEESTSFQPIDLKAKAARQKQIQQDLTIIDGLLAKHRGNWDIWYKSLNDFRMNYKKQYDSKSQKWIGDSFFSAGYFDNSDTYSPEFVKSVIAFKDYLAARNVDLILVRVPHKGEIVDDLFAPVPTDQITNPYLLRMYKELLEADVEIIADIIPRAKDKRLKYPLMFWYQDFFEIHPAEGVSWVIAEEFAKRVSRYSRITSMPKQVFTLKERSTTEGWLSLKWPSGNPKFNQTDYVLYSTVVDNKERPVILTQGTDSPVLVLGSSFIASPSLSKGGTIPHYFTYLTGIVPDLVHRNAADFMMPRSVAREGDDFLRNRSVCLFPFVPGATHKALASLPIFDPDKSLKTLLTSYSGPTMHETIQLLSKTSEGVFSYSPDGTLQIQPVDIDRDNSISLSIKVPHTISKFSYFILAVEFKSRDRTSIKARYSGQSDSIKRSDSQPNSEEVFAFETKSDKLLTIELVADKYLKTPISIKCIKFYGVERPSYYKVKSSAE